MSDPAACDPCEGVQREMQRFAVRRGGIVAVAGLWASGAFWLTLRIPTEPFAPFLWPFLYGTAAILTLAVLAQPESHRFHRWLTAVGLAALILRPSVVLTKWLILGTSTVADVGFACTIYALGGYLWVRWCQGSLRAWRFHVITKKVC